LRKTLEETLTEEEGIGQKRASAEQARRNPAGQGGSWKRTLFPGGVHGDGIRKGNTATSQTKGSSRRQGGTRVIRSATIHKKSAIENGRGVGGKLYCHKMGKSSYAGEGYVVSRRRRKVERFERRGEEQLTELEKGARDRRTLNRQKWREKDGYLSRIGWTPATPPRPTPNNPHKRHPTNSHPIRKLGNYRGRGLVTLGKKVIHIPRRGRNY